MHHPRRDRGSNAVEFALLVTFAAGAVLASVAMYRAITFELGDLSHPSTESAPHERP